MIEDGCLSVWDKDVPALVGYAKSIGAYDTAKLFRQ